LATLSHPCIVGYKESIMDKEVMYIIMEYCDGGDLSEIIQQQLAINQASATPAASATSSASSSSEQKKDYSYFPEEQILDWFTQIALALRHMHTKQILHRDLKAQNVFMTK
jgi:NIMA (never in mitosis gene a)-related kinase